MSIINDALKKVETAKPASRNKPQRWFVFSGTTVACLLVIIVAMNFFKSPAERTPVASVSIQKAAPAIETPYTVFDLRKIDIEIARRSSDFHLSGILYDQQKPMAIINQRIVGEGALVNGAELLEIQPNHVRLSLKGKEFTLKIK